MNDNNQTPVGPSASSPDMRSTTTRKRVVLAGLVVVALVGVVVAGTSDLVYLVNGIGGRAFSAPKKIGVSQTPVQIDEFGVCKVVTNETGADIFVPVDTAEEWANFRANVSPSVATLSDCVPVVIACWQTPSSVTGRCQSAGACSPVGAVANAKCLDMDGNMEQPPGQDFCIEVPDLSDSDCNQPI